MTRYNLKKLELSYFYLRLSIELLDDTKKIRVYTNNLIRLSNIIIEERNKEL